MLDTNTQIEPSCSFNYLHVYPVHTCICTYVDYTVDPVQLDLQSSVETFHDRNPSQTCALQI